MNQSPDQHLEEPLFSRPYTTEKIPAGGVKGLVEASESERVQIAAALDLTGLKSFGMKFQLRRAGPRQFKFSGQLAAQATQDCVVSLRPVETVVDEKIEIEFWPPEDVAREEAEVESESMFVSLEGPEPIQDGVIDVGQLAYEHLAASLDPYPKEAGAQFDWSNPMQLEEEVSADRPFAALAQMRDGRLPDLDQTE